MRTRIIPPKHYKGAWPVDKSVHNQAVRFCETTGGVYAYLKTGEKVLCAAQEGDSGALQGKEVSEYPEINGPENAHGEA